MISGSCWFVAVLWFFGAVIVWEEYTLRGHLNLLIANLWVMMAIVASLLERK